MKQDSISLPLGAYMKLNLSGMLRPLGLVWFVFGKNLVMLMVNFWLCTQD